VTTERERERESKVDCRVCLVASGVSAEDQIQDFWGCYMCSVVISKYVCLGCEILRFCRACSVQVDDDKCVMLRDIRSSEMLTKSFPLDFKILLKTPRDSFRSKPKALC
jgi:hypothetical protein